MILAPPCSGKSSKNRRQSCLLLTVEGAIVRIPYLNMSHKGLVIFLWTSFKICKSWNSIICHNSELANPLSFQSGINSEQSHVKFKNLSIQSHVDTIKISGLVNTCQTFVKYIPLTLTDTTCSIFPSSDDARVMWTPSKLMVLSILVKLLWNTYLWL